MHKIKIKHLSVNESWQGRRFRSPKYKKYIADVMALLTRIRKPKIQKRGKLYAHYKFHVSNMRNDVDNGVKPLQDILFNWLSTDDSRVNFLIVQKLPSKKGNEHIEFQIDNEDGLINYLKQLIEDIEKDEVNQK